MKKSLFAFLLIPSLFSFLFGENLDNGGGGVVIENYTRTEAVGDNAKTQSSISTTVNGEQVTVETNQPGSIEVKNINGKVEVKTSKGITPTIIVTGVPSQSVKIERKEQASFFRRFMERLLRIFRLKTKRT